jgi:hypothetical protein
MESTLEDAPPRRGQSQSAHSGHAIATPAFLWVGIRLWESVIRGSFCAACQQEDHAGDINSSAASLGVDSFRARSAECAAEPIEGSPIVVHSTRARMSLRASDALGSATSASCTGGRGLSCDARSPRRDALSQMSRKPSCGATIRSPSRTELTPAGLGAEEWIATFDSTICRQWLRQSFDGV